MNEIDKTFEKNIQIVKVEVSKLLLTVHLNDERIISIPIKRFSRLAEAFQNNKHESTQHFQISPSGYGIHWPDLDEDISIKAFL